MAVHVAETWRYPVKSLAGEPLESTDLTPAGIPGDRCVHVLDGRGRLLAARTRPRMVTIPAELGPDGEPLIAGRPWRSAEALEAVRAATGDEARLVASENGHRHDDTALLVATDGALDWMGVDPRRFRANLVLGGVEQLDERGFEGRRLQAGGAVISVEHLCERCAAVTADPESGDRDTAVLQRINAHLDGRLALNCEVVEPGTVSRGDPVSLL